MSQKLLLEEYTKNFPNNKSGALLIQEAYKFAQEAHKGQKRNSGEPYFIHVYETALQLAKWRLDAETITAGLLHDTIEDCNISYKQLSKKFGDTVAFLVDGITKLGKLKYEEYHDRNAESLRKMIIAISKDLRVVFIKLSDRLHNMKTLNSIKQEKQKRIALETTEIYAPIASRLGMQNLSGELEDLAFPYIYSKEYEWLKNNVKDPYEKRTEYLKQVKPIVIKKLKEEGINPIRIDYRAKRLYSLYKKLKRYDMNINQIYDLVALRIIVKTVSECYATLGIIHQLWPPLPGRIKDYIALPKPNGYMSLHTTVFSLEGKPAEFQIRTIEMHEHAENGAAAHWFYESNKIYKSDKIRHKKVGDKEIAWVKQLKIWQRQFPGSKEFLEALKIDLFSDRIFVLTPKGEVVDLPSGSTPIDFAYKIHTDLGHSCTGAKINNKLEPLDTRLQSGDAIEILIQKTRKPSESWLRFAKTSNAKKKIRNKINTSKEKQIKYDYRIATKERVGMLKDISSIFSRNHLTIENIYTEGTKKFPIIRIVTNIKNQKKADEIIIKIKNIKGVLEVGYKTI